MNVDLAVVGGGPAGLAAAGAASTFGLQVAVVDEGPVPGGRLPGQVHEYPDGRGASTVWNGQAVAASLLEAAEKGGVTLCPRSEVWGLEPGERGWRVHVTGSSVRTIEARYLLLATGAVQKPLALPGWTLPGVLTPGAIQTMINCHRIVPGRRALVVGIDPLSLTVAQQMASVGVEVLGVVLPARSALTTREADPIRVLDELLRLSDWAPTAQLRLAGRLARGRLNRGWMVRMFPRDGIRVWGVPVMLKRAAVEIRGTDGVESVVVADINEDGEPDLSTASEFEVDVVCTSAGLAPLTELAQLAGCRMTYVENLGGYVPLHGPENQTTVAGVYVAGSITGVEGSQVALQQGRLAAYAIAREAGRISDSESSELIREAQRAIAEAHAHSLPFYPEVAKTRNELLAAWNRYSHGVNAATKHP